MESGNNVVLEKMCKELPHKMVPMTIFLALTAYGPENCHFLAVV